MGILSIVNAEIIFRRVVATNKEIKIEFEAPEN
jgi:hypothetical protein